MFAGTTSIRTRRPTRSGNVASAPEERRGQAFPAHVDFAKAKMSDLAIFGGSAAFAAPLHVGCPNIPDRARLMARFDGILDRVRLTNDGPLVQELESRIAERTGVRHCIVTCNGTMGLQLAARALGLSGEVIVPAMTFVATAHALNWIGLRPVFADIDPDSLCLDPLSVERYITPRTTGILGVHLWGRACDVDSLQDMATRYGLKLLYDASHAFGCSHNGRPIGGFGDAEIFSLHATKFVSAGEGGAVVTNDDDLADRLRRMRNFGFSAMDTVTSDGINGKMSEFAAAVGLTSLESIDDILSINRRNLDMYCNELRGLNGVRLRFPDRLDDSNCQYVVLEIETSSALARDELTDVLHAEGILARRYFVPGCHRCPPYDGRATCLPNTDAILQRVLCLPTGTSMTPDAIQTICGIIRFTVERAQAIGSRLRRAS